MTDYAGQRKIVNGFIDKELGKHTFFKANSKSWHLRHESGTSHFAYSVTWAYPGSLSLAGDIGELTITHYNAMPTWWNAVHWFSGNRDHDYHLGKSNATKEYDADATIAEIIHQLEEDAKEIDLDDMKENFRGNHDLGDIFEVRVSDSFKDTIHGVCADGEHAAAQLCSDLGLSDYYGTRNWSHQRLIQMAAIYHWAAMVYRTPEFKEACDKAADAEELRVQVLMMDQHILRSQYAQKDPGMGDFIKHFPRLPE